MKKTSVNVVIAFVLGASVAGGIAVAEINNTGGVKACVDNRTKALFLSSDGKCAKGRSPLELPPMDLMLRTLRQPSRHL